MRQREEQDPMRNRTRHHPEDGESAPRLRRSAKVLRLKIVNAIRVLPILKAGRRLAESVLCVCVCVRVPTDDLADKVNIEIVPCLLQG